MSDYFQRTRTMTGRGNIASKTRDLEMRLKRVRVGGYGVTSGPLGTWVAYTPRQPQGNGGGRDTWAA